jgi:hypothetical protein
LTEDVGRRGGTWLRLNRVREVITYEENGHTDEDEREGWI